MDRKRVNGPEASVAPLFKSADQEPTPILNNENKRLDNRGIEDIRPICKFFFWLWIPKIVFILTEYSNSHKDRTYYTSKWVSIY